MKTKSKVKSVQATGTYDHSQHGTFYKYEYVMEDGTCITANHKKQQPFEQGSEVEYEVKGGEGNSKYGSVSKPKENSFNGVGKSNFQSDPKKQTIIVAQSSMTKAIDILLSGVTQVTFTDTKDFVDKTEALTDLLMKKQIELTNKHYENFKSL